MLVPTSTHLFLILSFSLPPSRLLSPLLILISVFVFCLPSDSRQLFSPSLPLITLLLLVTHLICLLLASAIRSVVSILPPTLHFSLSLPPTFSLSLSYSHLHPYLLFWLVSLRMFPLSLIPSYFANSFVLSFSLVLYHSFSCKPLFLSSFIFNLSLANFYEKFLSLSFLPPSFVLTSSYTLLPSLSSACHLSLVSSYLALSPSLFLPPSPSLCPSHYLYFLLSI